jgi:hypothetical protein
VGGELGMPGRHGAEQVHRRAEQVHRRADEVAAEVEEDAAALAGERVPLVFGPFSVHRRSSVGVLHRP